MRNPRTPRGTGGWILNARALPYREPSAGRCRGLLGCLPLTKTTYLKSIICEIANMKFKSIFTLLLLLLLFSACQPRTLLQGDEQTNVQQNSLTPTEGPVELPSPTSTPESAPTQDLELAFVDSDWDGDKIPNGQQCHRQDGENPSTPRIQVSNIPEGADAIILEFSDRTYSPMNNGGHGKIGFEISEGTNEVVIPSVPGHTFDLPEGFFLVQEHRASGYDTAGAYMPPCSGGIGNHYYVTIKAVKVLSKEDKAFNLLGQGILELGKY